MAEPLTLSRDQVRRIDQLAVDEFGLPGIVLMENASRQLADHAERMLRDMDRRHALVVAGGGNNGGDGFAAARHLDNRGFDVTIVRTKPADSYTGDARTNLDTCCAMGLNIVTEPVDGADLIVDGLLGTGLTSDVRGDAAEWIGWINRQPAAVLAIDTPSGLDCDTGEPLGCAVHADETVTFVALKKGFAQPGASAYTGVVHVADIGAPSALIARVAGE